jgi:hypothetical protein
MKSRDKFNNGVVPSRSNFLNNKVVVVDGPIGGGKGLISAVVGALPRVEMWVPSGKIEQICSMHSLGHISTEGAEVLIKNWVDEEMINLSIMRNVNCRPSDMSSVFRDARPFRYLKRIFAKTGDASVQRIIDEQLVLNLVTHAKSAHSLPLFNALSERLVYIRVTRCPMSEYMLNHLAKWSQRWGNDIRSGMIVHKIKNTNNELSDEVPFFMLHDEDRYLNASPIERAILMLNEWQTRGDTVIDNLKKSSNATIIEVPYEKFVFEPYSYINQIAVALETEVDQVTRKVMKKQKVPRASLTDAPKKKAYIRQGWTPPSKKNQTTLEQFNATREIYLNDTSVEFMQILDQITEQYIERYNIT